MRHRATNDQTLNDDERRELRGLPGPLPAGEVLLWQGSPGWWPLARRALHIHQVAGYFAVLLVWAVGSAVWQYGLNDPAIATHLLLLPMALMALGLLGLLAWLMARTTTYTITDRRVVMHFGVALPMTINIPFRLISAAGMTCGADGSGDIALSLSGGGRLSYLITWPHVRPWRLAQTQPALRGLPDAARVARILSRALAASAAQPVAPSPEPHVSGVESVTAHAAAA